MTSIAVARNLRYNYGNRTVLDDVTFSVAAGTLFGLLGPNGSGKTTLFRLLATLIPMQSGELTVCGFDVTTQQTSVRRQLGMMHDPKVLLLDEPTSGLDPRARQEFWELVTAQQKTQGTTIIVATHLMPEAELCHRVLLLDRGRTVAEGTPLELQSRLDGERLTVRLRDAVSHLDSLRALIGGNAELQGDRITLRASNPAEQIREIIQAFGDQILSLELTRPSLEDVFLELTGRSLSQTGDTNAR